VPSPALSKDELSELGPGVRLHQPSFIADRKIDTGALARELQAHARSLGLLRVGFCGVEPFQDAAARLRAWLRQGLHGTMTYLEPGPDRAAPSTLLSEAKTLVVVALPYARDSELIPLRLSAEEHRQPMLGTVARYARGADYHAVLKQKLAELADICANLVGRPVLARACVDTAPLLERHAASLSGLGFTGKSTLSIVPGFGSYFLLGEMLLDVEIAPSTPLTSQCGSCRACLDACPTRAFVNEYVLDARRCIAYLTIEYQGVIPVELRALLGTRVFGCDVCQEVCPFNASPKPKPSAPELRPREDLTLPDLVALLELTSSGYRRLVSGSALRRASRTQLARNAAVALGNTRDVRAVKPLIRSGLSHRAALVRGHSAWALGQLLLSLPSGGTGSGARDGSDPRGSESDFSRPLDAREEIRTALEHALVSEAEPWVRAELESGLTARA
jgi:epoxyqueuosine reductase